MAGHGAENTQNTQSTQVVQKDDYFYLSRHDLAKQNAGMDENDLSDVICVLVPMSPAARRVVVDTAFRSPEHVLNIERFHRPAGFDHFNADFRGIALRLSSKVIHPYFGFTFGRNPRMCDIVLDHDSKKRVSNVHFRIYIHSDAILVLEDMSTNGTIVDGLHLRATKDDQPATRLIEDGATIRVGSEQDWMDFKVYVPDRQGDEEDRYLTNLETYRAKLPEHEHRQDENAHWARHQFQKSYQFAIAENRQKSTFPMTGRKSIYGMHWNGKPNYTVCGKIGNGAFATVYKLAARSGQSFFAVKELEKRRFIKDGRLDMRLENELKIMKSIRHPHIVNYVDYHEEDKHLYIIMEFVPKGDLQMYLSDHKILPEPDAKSMSSQVLQALVYLHKQKITHRDIKPDNILIESYEPFLVKLTDFGLSKVVKNNETFLKTFCGTLLYCAPEVFPDYDQQIRRVKRRHGGPPPKTFHSYSHSVDVWSYAAVLYFALCGQPPFQGVLDQTGFLMLKKILETPLDVTPLRTQKISEVAIDFVSKMLTKDPARRPTDRQCLAHPWLASEGLPVVLEPESDLDSIAEEDEDPGEFEEGKAFSQLSIADRDAVHGAERYEARNLEDDEIDFDDDDWDFLSPRASKRVKPDHLVPRNQIRDHADIMSSSIEADDSDDPRYQRLNNHSRRIIQPTRAGRLFGEIGASAFRSSGILGHPDESADDALSNVDDGNVSSEDGIPQLDGHDGGAAASLLGAEALVGRLHVHSPESAVSPDAASNEPETPKTPEVDVNASQDGSTQKQGPRSSQDLTPKPPILTKFSRRINIPIPPSFYYDENDPSTHNLEYASKVSGHDYVGEAANAKVEPEDAKLSSAASTDRSLRPTATDTPISSTPPLVSVEQMAIPLKHIQSPPRLGLLATTTDSFAPIFIPVESHIESWGRDPANTIIYPDIKDLRIPKRAIFIWHYAPGIEKQLKSGNDWTNMPGLYTCITTSSSNGIWVNDVHLRAKGEDGGQLTGRIHTGDIITVFENSGKEKSGARLRFICTFFHGEAATPRSSPFEVISVKQ